MNEKMTTEQFLQTYVANLLQGLADGNISYRYLTIECDFCPLRKLCEKDSESCPDKIETCEEFFQKNLADGSVFRLR